MSIPKEHDYIGLSETPPSMELRISDKFSSSSSTLFSNEDTKTNNLITKSSSFNLKETELRLGLPGSHSPDRKNPPFLPDVPLFAQDIIETNHTNNGFSLLSPLKNLVSGSKRGFSDAIDGVSSGKWVFSVGNGSEADLSKGAILLPPRGDNNSGNTQKSCMSGASMKEIGGVVNHPTNPAHEKSKQVSAAYDNNGSPPSAKAQVVGWPPIRSFRKNSMASSLPKSDADEGKAGYGCLYVKVSMDGAPYLRKVDLKNYSNYVELSTALEKMFSCFTIGQCGSHGLGERDGLTESHLKDLLHGSEYILTYEDKDGDWMLVGDVPWEMFTESCRRMRIMNGSEAVGLAPRAIEKCKNTTVS